MALLETSQLVDVPVPQMNKMNIRELKAIVRQRGLPDYSQLNKAEFTAKLLDNPIPELNMKPLIPTKAVTARPISFVQNSVKS